MADRAVRQVAGAPPAVGTLDNLRQRAHGLTGVGVRPGRGWSVARFWLDAAMLLTAAVAATLGASAVNVPAPPAFWLAVFAALVLGISAIRGMYGSRLHYELLEDLRVVVVATSLAAMVVLSMRELVSAPPDLSAQVIRTWAFATAYLAAGRIALDWSQAQTRRQGEGLRPTLIIGAGRIGRVTAQRLLDHPELGLRPIGFLDKEPLEAAQGEATLPVLGASWDVDRVIEDHGVQHVIVSFSTAPNDVLLRLVRRCDELGVEVAFVPRLFEKVTQRLTIDYLGGIPLVSARVPNPRGIQFAAKYAADRVLAVLLVALASPILIVSALAVLISLGRPVLFRQRRVGLDGREFDMFKFRTMSGTPEEGEADADWAVQQMNGAKGPVQAPLTNPLDDRRTRVGEILRKLSIDELPQLFNVVAGHMSLVGPRPERTHYVRMFKDSVYRYGDRHRVKSGITGWAQVHGLRGKTSLADRVEWDNYYIENWSLWLDVKVLLLTFLAVIQSPRQVEDASRPAAAPPQGSHPAERREPVG